ncbi:hypothetical protein EVAR_98831_1 [Eumeta japonica]|uniref:Uncharacterized protein n=1 Tax=Eumeta variegata TaxID=151549 RepID=A0A4C1YMT3_EUMVA|nr:hypothetical protein EVAR_98831_1 [Eumeta japonica]
MDSEKHKLSGYSSLLSPRSFYYGASKQPRAAPAHISRIWSKWEPVTTVVSVTRPVLFQRGQHEVLVPPTAIKG